MRCFTIVRLFTVIFAVLASNAAYHPSGQAASHKAACDGPLPWPSAALIDAPHRFIGSADPLRSLAHVEETTLGGKTTDYVSGAGMTIARLIDGVPTYVHSDHLGSPREFSTSAGGLAGWAHYSPFGVDYHSNLPGDQAGFTGPLPRPSAVIIDPPDQLFGDANLLRSIKDSDTGLNYMQARYYDPIIGRFLSVDPVTFMDTGDPRYFNRYAYVANDPINLTDAHGTCLGPAAIPCVIGAIRAGKAAHSGYKAYKGYRAAQAASAALTGGMLLNETLNQVNSENANSAGFPDRKAAEERLTGGAKPDTKTGQREVFDNPPTGESADEIFGEISGAEGVDTKSSTGERGPVDIATLPDGSKVIDRNSATGPRTIETQTKSGKTKTEVRFPEDPPKR